MARTDNGQFLHLAAGDTLAAPGVACKRILVTRVTGATSTVNITDAAAALLFSIGLAANKSEVIEGPFNLKTGIIAPANINLTLIR
jgi:hypothetical protein